MNNIRSGLEARERKLAQKIGRCRQHQCACLAIVIGVDVYGPSAETSIERALAPIAAQVIENRPADGGGQRVGKVNFPPDDLKQVFAEMWRILRPGGGLLLAFHVGSEMKHLDLWWDLPVDIDFYFFEVEGISRLLTEARFQIEQNLQREPYADVQHQSRRCYIEAKKPGDMS